jgi:hypothetical protein
VVGAQDGPTDGHKLTATTFIQRLNTSQGVAPSTGCTLSANVGKKALVDYEADYFFYKAADRDTDGDDYKRAGSPSCGSRSRLGLIIRIIGRRKSIDVELEPRDSRALKLVAVFWSQAL